jgi:alpha-ketoglutarate-dependent taurine dioxygenase
MVSSAAGWREHLAVAGWALVRGVAADEDNAALRALGQALGATSRSGLHAGPNLEQHGINRVEAMDLPRLDPSGRVVLSTSADEFPLHTDDTFAASPARYVLMHCLRPDPSGGGVSLLGHADDIVARLPADTVARLRQCDFASPAGPQPVLFDAGGAQGIRFNRRDMQGYGEKFGPVLSADQLAALDQLLAAARGCTHSLRMQAGDCLVVDNHRVLHGRTAFDPRSGRLLKRLRVA